MAKLVDAHDSKSCGFIHESSSLSPGTTREGNEALRAQFKIQPYWLFFISIVKGAEGEYAQSSFSFSISFSWKNKEF
ncbi:MAG: hypothetical protein UR65_C0042G0009 [Candidatus Moranbacteria bacterium GW2011_GWE2_35_164]|nr:MAG: hypothetical protein UR65_C0042G0009 [Candidatus Moranbacteria bacterium GW2011_GWE2_35_164]